MTSFLRVAFFVLAFALATTAAAQAQGAALTEARARIARGEELYTRGDYDAALVEFEAAYELADGHPVRALILYNVGQCHERSFRYDLAIDYYERYIAEAGEAVEDRAAVEERIRVLGSMLGTLVVETNTDASLWVDGREYSGAPGRVRVPAGAHRIELRAPGHESAVARVVLPAGTTRNVRLTLRPLAREAEGLDPIPFYVTAGAAIVATSVGAGLAISTRIDRDDIDARLADPVERWTVTEDDRSSLESRAIAADVLFGTGAALGATAVVLYLLTDWDADDERPTVAPMVGEVNGIAVRGAL